MLSPIVNFWDFPTPSTSKKYVPGTLISLKSAFSILSPDTTESSSQISDNFPV